jgi:hypothetical protein
LAKTKPKKQNVKYRWFLSVDVIMDRKKWRGRGGNKKEGAKLMRKELLNFPSDGEVTTK